MTAVTNREKILTTCLNLFANRGFEAVGVQEMCAASGVSKPTVYHYFHSKRGVLDALVETYGERMQSEILPACVYGGDVKTGLEGIFFAFRTCFRRDPLYFRLFLSLSSAPSHSEGYAAMLPQYSALFSALEQFFEAASQDHGNMKGRARPFASSFLGVVNSWSVMELNGFVSLSDETVRAAVHQFMHGIFS